MRQRLWLLSSQERGLPGSGTGEAGELGEDELSGGALPG